MGKLFDCHFLHKSFITVTNSEAIDTCRRLAAEEGLFCGFSSGANVCAGSLHFCHELILSALKILTQQEFAGKTVVCVLCDSGRIFFFALAEVVQGLKYLSTDLWDSMPKKTT
jgi:cysteine synthase A